MYLKALEMQGFKSFPDKVRLTFEGGLTAVVGPNGSGKSNIGDAVSWVMGEQSIKNLRGAKMEDVIFSGTTSRKPVGFAAVTLHIDNSSGLFDINDNEISVTRKLYRSGESEFLINGKAARLKDITELFLDTGLGKNGYSIIGQGRIAEIISAKSVERREIFEEAAGISKFRFKKKEAVTKLEAAQAHFLRLSDSFNELEARIEPLRAQSEKAQKFLEYSEKQKKLEISFWLYSLDQLKDKLKELEEKLLVSTADYEALCKDEDDANADIEENSLKMQRITSEVDRLQQEILSSERRISDINSELAVIRHDIVLSEKTAAELAEKKEKELSSIDALHSAQEQSREKIKALKNNAEMSFSAIQDVVERMESAAQEERRMASSFGTLGTHLNELNIKRSELQIRLSSATAQLSELISQSGNYDSIKAELNASLQTLNRLALQRYTNRSVQSIPKESRSLIRSRSQYATVARR